MNEALHLLHEEPFRNVGKLAAGLLFSNQPDTTARPVSWLV